MKEPAARELQRSFTKVQDKAEDFAIDLRIDIERLQDTLLDEIEDRGLKSLDELEDYLSE